MYRLGHITGRIARKDDKQNGPILRRGTFNGIPCQPSRLILGETASPRNTSTA